MKQEEQENVREAARDRRRAEKQQQKAQGGNEAGNEMGDAGEDLSDDDLDDDDEMDADGGDSSNPMAALLSSARARAEEYDNQHEDDDDDEMDDDEDDDEDGMDEDEEDGGAALGDVTVAPASGSQVSKETSRRAFDKVFKQVVDAADVVLYVLDARDPEGTRSKEVEREIMAADAGSKRMILILNKIDLVPPTVLKGWLVHLRRYFPTLPLKASNGTANAHSFDHKQLTVKGTSETLFRALKSYAHNKQMKRSVSVGIIGYPNVGKSSVINALTARLNKGSSNACPTGAEAGVTTNLREVKLDGKLKLIDSPGIVFPNMNGGGEKKTQKKKQDEHARLVFLNAIPPKQIEDPIPAVNLLLRRLSKSEHLMAKLLEVYGIPSLFPTGQDQTTDFLIHVARKRGRLGKGGVPNVESAAMTVITDWRDGRIQGWANVPVLPVVTTTEGASAAPSEGVDTKQIVSEWAQEFKIEGLWGNGEGDDEEMAE